MLRAVVLDRLEGADDPAELLACQRVLDGHLQARPHPSRGLGGRERAQDAARDRDATGEYLARPGCPAVLDGDERAGRVEGRACRDAQRGAVEDPEVAAGWGRVGGRVGGRQGQQEEVGGAAAEYGTRGDGDRGDV